MERTDDIQADRDGELDALNSEPLRGRAHVRGLGVDKEPLRRKEPWMACLEHNDLVCSRSQH